MTQRAEKPYRARREGLKLAALGGSIFVGAYTIWGSNTLASFMAAPEWVGWMSGIGTMFALLGLIGIILGDDQPEEQAAGQP